MNQKNTKEKNPILEEYRQTIDEIDEKLITLFQQRMDLAHKIGLSKKEENLPLYHPLREKEVLNQVEEGLPDPLKDYGKMWFGSLMEVSKSYQNELFPEKAPQMAQIEKQQASSPRFFPRSAKVAFQGTHGSYSQLACEKLFSHPQLHGVATFEEVFSSLEEGLCDFGVLPLENSTHGSVGPVFDLLKAYPFPIAKSIRLHVRHHLLVKPGTEFSQIRQVYSHEQALGQCGLFFQKHPHIQRIPTANTSFAAEKVAQSDDSTMAAIGSKEAAQSYGLEILEQEIQSTENNYTRFVCISSKPIVFPGSDKITVVIALPHKQGALYQILALIAAAGINLTKLESRPVPGSDFQFLFYLDLQGSIEDPTVFRLLSRLEKQAETFFFLGNYSEVS